MRLFPVLSRSRATLRPSRSLIAKLFVMPEQETIERAREDEGEGKSPSTQAGEFVREEMEHIREGKHGARSAKQAIAIGLSKARRAGVRLPPPKRGSARTKKQAARDTRKAGLRPKPSRTRSRAVRKALKRDPRRAASASGAIASGAFRRRATLESKSFSSGEKSCAHAQAKPLKPTSYFSLITRPTSSALPRSRTGRPWFGYQRDQRYPAPFSDAPKSASRNRSSRTSR